MVIYLRIKQSVCISDVILVTVQAIVGSCWSMHVHVRYTRLDEKSHETAPNKDGLHDLHERKPRSVFNEKIKLCSCCHSNRFWRCQGILFNVVVRAIQALSEKKFGFATSINRNKKKNIYSNDSTLRKKTNDRTPSTRRVVTMFALWNLPWNWSLVTTFSLLLCIEDKRKVLVPM